MRATVETSSAIRERIESARQARALSYVPYSKFAMGASVRFDSGHLVPGAVVENVSLGLAMCAESAALFAGVALGYGKPLALALAAPRTDGAFTYPCGACLQVALELGGPDLVVLAAAADSSAIEQRTVREPLPYAPRKVRSRSHQVAWRASRAIPIQAFATGKCLCIFPPAPPVGGGSVEKMVQLGSGL